MSKCLNLSDPTIRKMVNDFGEINVSKLLDAYYPDKTPTYEEFIANRKVKEALGFIPISKTKDEIGKSFPREISNDQLAKLKRLISNVNNRTKDFVYMIFNVERIGEADLFTWGLRKVKGSLDVAKKIDRAIGKFEKTIAKSDELALLKERLDLEKKVTPVYSKPVSLPKQELSDEEKSEQLRLEQEAMEYREEPPTIAKPEEPKAPIDKLTGDLKRPSYNKQKEYYLAKDVQSLLQEIVKFTEDVDTKLLAEALLKIPDINKIKLNVTKFNKETKDKGIITSYPDALGIYNSFENLIEVIGTLDKKTFETVFLHEVIHGITVNEFYSNKQFSDKINKLYNYALKFKDYRTSKGITLGEMYGMYNAKEFMSEAMTNPDFIYELSKYYSPIQEKLKEKNIFQEFINLVVDLIKNKLEGKGKKYIEDNLGKTVLNTISNYTKISSKGIYSISKFEEKQIKPGVEELFESNPELANAVYEALGFKGEKTIETAKGSTYRYLPSGKTQRFKKVEGKEYEPQDILTFVPNYEWIKSNNPQWLEKQGLENDTQYTQYLLEKVQGKGKVWIVDSKGKKIETNQDAKTADRLFIAFGKKDGTVEDFIPVSKEPVIGFYTYDSRIHFDEKGERYRDRHLGNKVVKITEGITPQQKQQALQLYSQYLDTIFPDSKVKDIVYHGTSNLEKVKSEGFSKAKLKTGEGTNLQGAGFYFAKFKQVLSSYAKGEKGGFVQAIVNLKNPLQERNFPEFLKRELNEENVSIGNVIEIGEKVDAWLSKNNKDGVIWNQISSFKEGSIEQETAREKLFGTAYNKNQKTLDVEHFSVKEPEQIHILGSQQDIQGFKEFVEGTKVSEGKLPHTKRIDEVNKTLLLDIKSGIEKGGIEDFNPKEEYHLTVIGFPIGKKIKEASQEVQDKVKELIDNTNFTISLKPEKYKIKKTYKTGERESIIQLASVPEINNFYKKLSDILGEELPEPFPHITLATKGDKMGIGVTSKADFETLSPVLMPTEKASVVPKRAEPGEQGKLFFSRKQGEVQYMLKAISILTSDLGKKIFEKGQKSGWSLEKTLTELKIPKDQIKLITLSGKKDREEIVTDILANYSYTVEISTAKTKLSEGINDDFIYYKGYRWYSNEDGFFKTDGYSGLKRITEEEYLEAYNSKQEIPTDYYSDLTVPGGTNYTENEIATPAIIPSIKGHAQFATDKGIGWFRSDDKLLWKKPEVESTVFIWNNDVYGIRPDNVAIKNLQPISTNEYIKAKNLAKKDYSTTKTRRILEVQSDLFQKGRDKELLVPINEKAALDYMMGNTSQEMKDLLNSNQFLQLLNKDNNWVTFFVKSIIQDSAKRGYEKVLFPTGNTASKIEGQESLEEFKQLKKSSIYTLEESNKEIKTAISNPKYDVASNRYYIPGRGISSYSSKDDFLKSLREQLDKNNKEITQLKQELERVETEGFGALKPIFKFYEENVANVLKKQGFSPKVITDEYGNTWNEIEITPQMAEDYILFSTKKTEVERILTEGEVELREIIKTPEKEIVQEKLKNPRVIEKMRAIINALGIKLEIATLPEEIAAQADILNRLIKFAEDSITEDNFTEETVHFIVEIIEQKDPKLYKMLESEIWKYEIYTSVKNEYSNFPEYRNSDGSLNVAKIKKEAIGQLLVAKLLENADIKDEKNFWGSVWETMSNFIKNLFYGVGYGQRDEFQNLVDSIMQNPELITSSDVAYLQGPGVFFSRKTKTGVPSSLARAKKRFGTKREGEIKEFENEIEAFEYFKALNADIQTVTEKELNPLTNEYEDVDYYIYKGNKKARVTAIISEANKKTFNNISQDEIAKALREAKMQKGTAVHKTIQDILERYIDTDTGLLRDKPLDKPANINIPAEAYKRLENHLSKRLESYPTGTRFLIETKVVNEEQGYGGTIDFMAFLPTGETDILDWKTTDVTYWEAGERKKRFDISPFNQTYWRTQLSFYKRALESNGVSNFRYTRAIPIAMETRQTLVDKSKAATPDNVVYNITNLQVGSIEPKKIKKDEFYLVPVSLEEEKTGIQELDDLIKKLQGIYERIRTTQYKKEEAYKKRQELDRLNSAIREIQTKRTATLFTGLFTESFDRFKKLEKVQFDFLENIEDKKFLSKEQENQLHQYFNEIYSAVEFLDTFQSFPSVIDTLYKQEELSQYEKQVKEEARKIGVNSQKISTNLKNKSKYIMEKVGKLYNIDELLAEDNKNPGLFSGFTSILHREEKSIQFAARLINVIKFLGQKEVNDFFNEDTGKFTKVFSAVKEWGKQNKKSFKEIYSYFLAKDQNGNPLRQLIDKIRPEYRTELKTKKEEFETFKKGIEQTAADIGYTGENYDKWVAREYKEHVMSWLEKNYNLDVYDKNYKEALDKYKESIKNLRLDEDAEINKTKKQNLLKSWIADHDIYSSPNSISLKNNYLLYGEGVLKEDSWYSDEYKFLKQAGNEPLLEAYELFTSLNKRAQENGMLDDIFSARLFLPNVADPSLQKAAFVVLKDGSKGAWYSISKVWNFIKEYLGFLLPNDTEGFQQAYDPLTGKELRRIPVKYKYVDVPEIERKENETDEEFEERKKTVRKIAESELSSDLFEIYAKWADHIIKYEMLSNYENRFKMIQLVESLKDDVLAVDSKGNIIKQKEVNTQMYKSEYQLTPKDPKVLSELNQIINNYVYSTNLDVKPEFYKIGNLLYDYASLKLLGLNITSWISNIVGATYSARFNEGKAYKKNDFVNIGVNAALGVFNENMSQYGSDLFTKSRYLINTLDTRIQSEYDRDVSRKFKTEGIYELGEIAFAGFRLGDHFIQDAIATSIFLNTTVKDGKLININDFVKAKYNAKIYDTTISSAERKELLNQRDEEIEQMKREENLFRFVKEQNGKFSIEGIDFNTEEGMAEMLRYQNLVAHYIKQAIGNVDEFDKSINRMSWGWKFIMQFKNWMPRVIGSRFQELEYQYELDDYHYGRAKIFMDSFANNLKVTLKEVMRSLIEVIPFVDRKTGSVDLIKAAKDAYIRKRNEAIRKNKPFDLTEAEFVDIYITGFRNQMSEFRNVIYLSMAIAMIAMAAEGEEDKWYWKLIYKTLFKVKREAEFVYDPEQVVTFFSAGVAPILTVVIDLFNIVGEFKKEILEPEKGKPIATVIESIPIARELHYWLSAMSEEYADMLGIEQPRVEKNL